MVVVELDKVDMDVEIFYDGFLVKIVIMEGEIVFVGVVIGLFVEIEEEIVEVKVKV